MAIVWGGYSGGKRLGVEVGLLSQTESAETWACTVYVEKYSATWDRQNTWSVTGSFWADGTFNLSTGSTLAAVWSGSLTFPRIYGSVTPGSVTFSATGVGGNYPPAVTAWFSISARAYTAPAAPTGATATRETDTTIRVGWTAVGTQAAPVEGTRIERSTDGGKYVQVADVTGAGVNTWLDTGVSAGHYYMYRVATHGAGGTSPLVDAGTVYTTPSAPVQVSARKNGMDIVVSWRNTARGAVSFAIYENGARIATVGVGGSTFTITTPSTSTSHTYTLRAVTPDGLESADATSNTVQLLTAPYAPSALSPDGGYASTGRNVVLSWAHNSADTTPQTRAEIQVSDNVATPNWVTVATVNGTTSRCEYAAGDMPRVFVWRVRTWAQDAAKPSPWSSVARVTVTTPPSIQITAPAQDTVVDTSRMTVELDTSSTYTGARYELVVFALAREHTRLSGVFTNKHATITVSDLDNDTVYTIRATAIDYVQSAPVEHAVRVEYATPTTPTITTRWHTNTASVEITVDGLDITPDSATSVKSVTIRQVLPDGTLSTLVDNASVGTTRTMTVVDYFPHPTHATTYLVTVTTRLGQSATFTTTIQPPTLDRVVLVSADMSIRAQLIWNVETSRNTDLQYATTIYMLGRDKPVLFASNDTNKKISCRGVVVPDYGEDVTAWEKIATTPTPFLYRDPSGIYMWGAISGMTVQRDRDYHTWDVSFTVTEVEDPRV